MPSLCQRPWQTSSVSGMLGLGVHWHWHLQSSTCTGHHGAHGKEGPYHQEMVRPLYLGLAEPSPRNSRVVFGQAEVIPRMANFSLPSYLVPSLQGAWEGRGLLPAATPHTVLALAEAPERKSLRRIECQFTN